MIIIEKNEGEKIPYAVNVSKKTICFDDDLTIKLSKREKDDPVHIDICFDRYGDLVVGAAAGRYYVAEIDIPARRYEPVEPTDTGEVGEEENTEPGMMNEDSPAFVPVPLDMDTVTLTLWSIEEA